MDRERISRPLSSSMLRRTGIGLVFGAALVAVFLWGMPETASPLDGSPATSGNATRVDAARAQGDATQASTPIQVQLLIVAPSPSAIANGLARASGTLRADREVTLSFAVAGVVHALGPEEGARVDRGTMLARLDPIPFESAVAQARSRVDYLERRLARSRMLRDNDALTDEEFDAQEAELTGARAQLTLAEWNLGRSTLRAPFPARVLARHLELGQVVGGTVPALELIAIDQLELRAALPASDLASIDWDAPVAVEIRDDTRLFTSARVHHRPIASDDRSGSVPVRLIVDNPDGALLPGMVAEAHFTRREPARGSDVLVIPVSALRLREGRSRVLRLRDDRVEEVEVELGPVRQDQVVVLSGLSVGDRIVNEAPDRLRDGDPVSASIDGGAR